MVEGKHNVAAVNRFSDERIRPGGTKAITTKGIEKPFFSRMKTYENKPIIPS
jgi:hypothetical protein